MKEIPIKTCECPAVVAAKAHVAGQLENYSKMMSNATKKNLEADGWVIGDTQKFLNLSDEEMKIIRESEEAVEYKNGIHDNHCCKRHGCKYGDSKCPVEFGPLLGVYCETCKNPPIEEQIEDLLDTVNAHKEGELIDRLKLVIRDYNLLYLAAQEHEDQLNDLRRLL